MTLTPAEELVDGGLQQSRDWRPQIRGDVCVREHRGSGIPVHAGYSFCRDCLAWLRGETDDDPLDDVPAVAKQQTPPEMWVSYGLGPPYQNHIPTAERRTT
jgi:hypothetical protein